MIDQERLLATLLELKKQQEGLQKALRQFEDFTRIMGEALASTIKEKDSLKSKVGILEMRQKDMAVLVGKIEARVDSYLRQPGAYLQ